MSSKIVNCEQAMERIHQVLDGDLMEAADRRELELHIEGCAGCRQASSELHTIQRSLRSLDMTSFSDTALETVWNRTTRQRGGRRIHDWGGLAAAAMLAFALLGVWEVGGPREATPTQAELDAATEQARMVLGLTAKALRRTERAAVGKVLADEVSPALNSVPIQWPGSSTTGRRKNGDEV
jgi:anti-sigma factor RsiW